MGRLALNVLLSFAQFEREITSERIRTKLPPPSARVYRSAVWRRSATTPGTARSPSTRPRQRVRTIFEAISGFDSLNLVISGPAQTRHRHQGADIKNRRNRWRHCLYPGSACPSPSQPLLHWGGRIQGRGIGWRAIRHYQPRPVRCGLVIDERRVDLGQRQQLGHERARSEKKD